MFVRSFSWLLYLPFLIPCELYAQNSCFNFYKVDIENGLSHNQVYSIYKDSVGFMWFGTGSGLNRFDGYNCKVFINDPADSTSLDDNYVSDIYGLPGNKIWIGTKNGSSVYDPVTERFDRHYGDYLQTLHLPASRITFSLKDRKGNYWFLFEKEGLFKYFPALNKSIHINVTGKQISNTSITHFAEDNNGGMWLAFSNGYLAQVNTSSLKLQGRFSRLMSVSKITDLPYRIFVDRQHMVWAYVSGEPLGLFKVDPASNSYNHFHTASNSLLLNDNMIKGIVQDGKGSIWVATDHGGINVVKEADNSSIHFIQNKENDKSSLSYNNIESIYEDDKGIVWVGTAKKGVSYANQNIIQFALYQQDPGNSNSLPFNDINYFAEDKKGNIWIASNGGGLIYFDRTNNQFKQYLHNPKDPNSLSHNVLVSLYVDHEDKVWIGTYWGGMDVFDGKTFTHYRHNPADSTSISDDRIWHIMQDDDRSMWIGTLNGGLDHMDPHTKKFTCYTAVNNIPKPIHSNYIPVIHKNSDGTIWVGTLEGIEILNKERTHFTHLTHTSDTNSLSHPNVTDILEDKRGYIWVGTRMGLNIYNPQTKKFRRITMQEGLPDNSILTLVQDKSGSLWITTPKGLSQLLVTDNHGNISVDVRNYTEVNKVQGRFFNESAALVTSDGLVLEGGSAGFNIIDPKKIIARTAPTPLEFTAIEIFNNEVNVGQSINKNVVLRNALPFAQKISLNHNENIFSIEFAALDFSHNNQYAYKLEGFNNNWMYAGGNNRKVTYTNLDPGTYYFKLRATNSDGVWGAEEKTLCVVINPPFWKTPLAFFAYLLCFGGMIWLGRRYTLEKAHMRFEVVQQRKESERIQALDAVKTKFFTNVSHEFRTPLSLIITPLDRIIQNLRDPDQKKQVQMVQRNAKRLLNLVNQLLDFRKMEVQEFKLQPTKGDIVAFIKDSCCSFSDVAEMKNIRLTFNSNVESFSTHFDKDKLEKILFNLLSNAFKYTSTKGAIDIQVVYIEQQPGIEEQIRIVVTDNGIGIPLEMQGRIFERFFQHDVPANITNAGTGIGLAITKEFIRLHNGSISVKSDPGIGTSFTVSLPVQTLHNRSTPIVPIREMITAVTEMEAEDKKMPVTAGKLRPVILLVEDNDDFRFYLKDNLNQHYEVVETADGQEAWEKLEHLRPDLVVSDVMMPFMDGIELSRRIRKSPVLGAIPLILLTSVDDEEMQLESYRLGVNDYMTKPFTYEILASRIKNLLANAKQAAKKPSRVVEVNPTEIEIPAADEQFLKQVLEVIEKNMSNTEFTVEELSKELFMHRAGMYRKLLALTGISPQEFIRDIRLKRGRQLLEKSQMTVSEIAYETGFSNPKKFSQHFKEKFGVTPSQFQKEHAKIA